MNLDKAKYIANKVMNLFREEGLTNEDVGVTLFLLTLKCAAAKQEAAQDSMREADKRPFNPKMPAALP